MRIFRYCIIATLFFSMGFAYKYYVPRLESWMLAEVKKQSQEHLPMHIVPEKLSFHLFPLGAVLENISVVPKAELKKHLAPTRIDQVGATLNLLSLLRGQIRFSRVYVRTADISIFLDADLFASPGKSKNQLSLADLHQLPVDEIALHNVVVQGKVSPHNLVFRSEAIDLIIENRYRSFLIDLDVPKFMLKPSGPARPIVLQMQARTLLESREAQISAFKLKADESYIVASGRLNGDFNRGIISGSAFKARSRIALPDVAYWLKNLPQIKYVPKLRGLLDFELGLESRDQEASPKMNLTVSGSDVQIDRYLVGKINGSGTGSWNRLQMPTLAVTNSAGSAELKDLLLERDEKIDHQFNIKTTLVAKQIEIGQLLKNIGIQAPVAAFINGTAPCAGSFKDKIALNCEAQVSAHKMSVTSGAPKNSVIVALDKMDADGTFTVTQTEVKYNANAKLSEKSKGKSNGVINYDTGFKINFETSSLDSKDIKNLANLKLEGLLNLKGSTEGTADWGTVQLDAHAENLWLEDYPLGTLTSQASYKAGHLKFANAQGQLGVSRYAGKVTLDLLKEQIAIDGQMPFVDLKDIFSLFQRKTKIPFVINGTGTGSLTASGPFNFRKMSYALKSTFFRGSAFDESFDRLTFNVSSDQGNVKSDLVQLAKANGIVDMVGTINPEAVINAQIAGKRLRLEQSENVMNFGLDIQGLTEFTIDLKGELPRPSVLLDGKISSMLMAEKPTDDSQFRLNVNSNRIEGSGNFFGSMIEANFNIPFEPQSPFSLRFKTKKWDFTNVFSLLSHSARQLDFETVLSMEANLQAPNGGFWNSTGEVIASEFVIRKGASSLRSQKPMRLDFDKGQITSKNFELTSGDSYLRLEAKGLTKNSLNASLNGKLDLSLVGLLTPFISDLRGNLAVSMDLKGSIDQPNMSGSAYIDKGYAKLRDFPHPFSALRADLLFNQAQVLINSLRADFAGGKASGEGRIEFIGSANNPVDIRGIFNEVNLNIPDGFNSKGSGQIAIRGSQFPYLMQIQYDVSSGEITTPFSGGSASGSVKASSYLPKFIYNESFHPFTLLLDVNVRNPILVHNSLVNTQVSGSMKAVGTPDRLALTGTFTPLPGGKVFFNDVPFDVTSGYVEYQDSPPENPKIYVTATTTVNQTVATDASHQQENQYDITLLVQGRGQNPQLTLTSQPPLAQKEIVSLLALGLTPEAYDQSRRGGSVVGAGAGAAIGNAILQKPGKKLKDALGIDVKLSSAQTAVQENGSSPKVTFSKQWTPKLGVSASGTIDANSTRDVKVEYKVKRGTSVIGSWEGKEQGASTKTKDASKSVFGLDLEYKVQFK